ncbi:hypothetical protein K9L97_04280 [Candidatus Woesearchaeota archaeon]|nr:hypothetical protein [Candidatus Woesearchaeota archaeon]
MGLFGIGKNKEDPLKALQDLNLDNENENPTQLNNFNNQNNQDPLNDMDNFNSNPTQNMQDRYDSFGNKMRNQDEQPLPRFNQNQQTQQETNKDLDKDMQLILAKLDTIKAEITSMNHRLEIMESKNHDNQRRYKW